MYNELKKWMLENSFVLLNDDDEYLIGYKADELSKQVQLTKYDNSLDDKLVRITLDYEEVKELYQVIER